MKLLITVLALAAIGSNADDDLQLFSQGAAKFTGKFFSEVVKSQPGKSVVMSAFSVEYPLAQLALGATGESHDELLANLGLPNDNVTRAVFPYETNQLHAIKGVTLKLASKIYVPEGFTLKQKFEKDSREVFNSEVQNLDFTKSVESANTINSWVESQTNNRIKDLVTSDQFDGFTRLVLVNAIYFKGSWKKKFNKLSTEDRDFHVSADNTVKIPTMYQESRFKYGDSEELDAQLLEMPYEGDEVSMLIVLPKKIDGLAALQEKLKDPKLLQTAVDNMYQIQVNVFLPKMKIETTINLKDILPKMGIKRIFDSANSGLTELVNTHEKLYVSEAKQKAFVEVNEEGAEAAAANVFIGVSRSAHVRLQKIYFRADRPFLFSIRTKATYLFAAAYSG